MTPAQQALSAVQTPAPKAERASKARVKSITRKSEPSVIVGADVADQSDNETEVAADPRESPEDSLVVPKNRAPLVVVGIVMLIAIGAGGYTLFARSAGSTPTTTGTQKVAVKEGSPVTAEEPKVKPDGEPTTPQDTEPNAAAPKREQVTPTGPVFKVVRRNGSLYLFLGKGVRVQKDELFRLVGVPLEGGKREVLGTAAVLVESPTLPEILTEEDLDSLPKDVFAYHDATAVRAKKPRTESSAVVATAEKPVVEKPVVEKPREKPVEKPAEKPSNTTLEVVKPVEPAAATVTKPGERRVIKGDVKLERRRAFGSRSEETVSVSTREGDVMTGCTVWLPSGKSRYYDRIPPTKVLEHSLDDYHDDTRPLDANLQRGTWALTQCKEGAGYFYFTNATR